MSTFAGENVTALKMNALIMMKQLGNGLSVQWVPWKTDDQNKAVKPYK